MTPQTRWRDGQYLLLDVIHKNGGEKTFLWSEGPFLISLIGELMRLGVLIVVQQTEQAITCRVPSAYPPG